MGHGLAEAEEMEKKAEEKLNGWGLAGSRSLDAADLFHKAADCFKGAESWDKAGSIYRQEASCLLKAQLETKHDAAQAYVNAAHCYEKTNISESISCLKDAVNLLFQIERRPLAAGYLKEIAELYESEQNIKQAFVYYEKSAEIFENEEVTTTGNQCKQKVAQLAAQLEQYQKATVTYEEIAHQSLNNDLLKYRVTGYLFKAGICQLCKGDVLAISNALERYQGMHPTFSGTREYRFLADIAAAINEEDVGKFTDVVRKFDSVTPLDSWKTTLLLRIKEKLNAKELEEDDLT